MTSQRYSELKHLPMSPALRDYLVRSGSPLDPVVESLAARTAETGGRAVMMIPEEQASLLTILARLTRAKNVLDIGTFTGMSALSLAYGLVPGGRVTTCDVTDRWLDIAQQHWTRAGVADRIDFRLGPATDTLAGLPAGAVVDLAFLDADKGSYLAYYEAIVPLLRPGGLLIVDNVLVNGYVLDPDSAPRGFLRDSAGVLRALNARIASDERMFTVMLPIADGLTLARKKD